MNQNRQINRRIVLASRPQGAPNQDNFRLENAEIPTAHAGQVLLRTVYLSLDPYMRGRMNDTPSYAPPVAIGAVMVGGAVCRVMESQHPDFAVGDWVLANSGWQDYCVSDGTGLMPLGEHLEHPSLALGVLGMPGFTAYMGLLDIGQPKPGETVVMAAATGAVGSVVGQIAKLKGCGVVGIAGGLDKCRAGVETFGFDACVDHYADDFPDQLARACPKGIDVYFESVGGKVFDAVLPLLNAKAHSCLRVNRALQRYRTAKRPRPSGVVDANLIDPPHQGSGIHYLRRLWLSIRRVRRCHGAVGQGRQDQVLGGCNRRARRSPRAHSLDFSPEGTLANSSSALVTMTFDVCDFQAL